MVQFRHADADRGFRLAFEESGRPSEWAEHYRDADKHITQAELWAVGIQRYYLLLALAQLRKCVIALPDNELPELRESKTVRLLRDIDEHWEQGDDSRSLRELRDWKPDLGVVAGALWSNNKHVWFGSVSLAEIADWVIAVERAVRASAAANGDRIPEPDERLPDSGW